MSTRRLILWVRLLVGAGFMYQGVSHIIGMREASDLFALSNGWQGWPFVGSMRPLELVLWLALAEFALGVFLFCGLLTRILGVVAVLVSGFELAAIGLGAGPIVVPLLIGSAAIGYHGGGAGTMDTALGNMQRRSIEREAARVRAREEARRHRDLPAGVGNRPKSS